MDTNTYKSKDFNNGLINSIIAYMNENEVKKMPFSFLASGEHGFPESAKLAKRFMEVGGFEYLFIKENKLYVHVNYKGRNGLGEYVYLLTAEVPTFYNYWVKVVITPDLLNIIRICYDTIGNKDFRSQK